MNPSIARPDATAPAPGESSEALGDVSAHRLLPITPFEQAERVRAFEEALQDFDSMPDNDPAGAWEEAMRDLDAHRTHRKLFEGII